MTVHELRDFAKRMPADTQNDGGDEKRVQQILESGLIEQLAEKRRQEKGLQNLRRSSCVAR